MKRLLSALLVASIAGNLVLAVALAWHAFFTRGAVGTRVTSADAEVGATVTPPGDDSTAQRRGWSQIWRALESSDTPTLIANLRAAGVPDDVARAIVSTMVARRFQARRHVILGSGELPPFWKTGSQAGSDPAVRIRLFALTREQTKQANALHRELFGDVMRDGEAVFSRLYRYGGLPDEKIDAIEAITADFSAKRTQATAMSYPGPSMPWEDEQRKSIMAEQRRQIATLLTPAELEAYDLHNSNAASSLRSRLTGFNPTEEEFRALYRLQIGFDAKLAVSTDENVVGYALAGEPRATDMRGREDEVRAVLGEQRFTEYQRVQDPEYRVAASVVDRLGLPMDNAFAVYAMQQEFQQRIVDVRGAASMSEAQKRAALSAIAAEANQRLMPLLTTQGVDLYKRSGGSWLRTLERQTQVRPQAPSP